MNREWTEEELEILRADRAAKVPVPVTAAKLNRPVPATYLRARKIGSLVQPHQSWDDVTVARLKELVLADPPLTDKRIASELGRTVTQVRWKMQDLGLIGVRDRSKLAKITSAGAALPLKPKAPSPVTRREPSQPSRSEIPKERPAAHARSIPDQAPPQAPPIPPLVSAQVSVERAVKKLELELKNQFEAWKAEAEAGTMRAAMAAIAEKMAIDQRLVQIAKRTLKPQMSRKEVESQQSTREEEARPPHATTAPIVAEPAPQPAPDAKLAPVKADKKGPLRAPGCAGTAPAPTSVPSDPKIVVLDTPAAPKAMEPDDKPVHTSGRGGWKAVHRNPSRLAPTPKGKTASRADATNLAEAAQAAIARFIAERGITKVDADARQSLITRLQARGYVVVRDGEGWLVDQRHHIATEQDLVTFASARGITLDVAA